MGVRYLAFDLTAALAGALLYGLLMLIAGLADFFLTGGIVVLLLVKKCGWVSVSSRGTPSSSLEVSVKISTIAYLKVGKYVNRNESGNN